MGAEGPLFVSWFNENPDLPPDADAPEDDDDPLVLAPDDDAALAEPPDLDSSHAFPEAPAPVLAEHQATSVDEDEKLKLEIKELSKPVPMKTVYTVRSLITRKKPEVLLGVQETILGLRKEGLRVNQIHTDRARELLNKQVRQWLSKEGITRTATAGIDPAANGSAESAVKWVKGRIRTLLYTSGAPAKMWPAAAQLATVRQMRERLPVGDPRLPPFWSKVWYRVKRYGVGGKEDLLPKWHEGRYACPSRMVTGGHVVQKASGGFTTCKGIKPFVWRIEEFVDKSAYEAEGLPVPATRVRHKRSLAAMSVDQPWGEGPRDEDPQWPGGELLSDFTAFEKGLAEVGSSSKEDLLFLAEEYQQPEPASDEEQLTQVFGNPGVISVEAMPAATHQRFLELVATLEKGFQLANRSRPQLQKIESPRIHVPRQQPEAPRPRHRMVFSWCMWREWQATRQPPRNWEPLPPLPGPGQPLPEDMIRVLPPVLWLLRDQDWAQEPEIEHGDENGQIRHLATVLSGEVTVLPRIGDMLLSYRLVEHVQGRKLLFVIRRVSLPHIPGENLDVPARPGRPH